MPSYAEITANRARVAFDFNGLAFQLDYCPELLTEKSIASLQVLLDDTQQDVQANMSAVNTALATFASWWDLTEGDTDEVMWPLTSDRLSELPIMLRVNALVAIVQDTRMGELSGLPSKRPSAGTPAPAARATSPKRASRKSPGASF